MALTVWESVTVPVPWGFASVTTEPVRSKKPQSANANRHSTEILSIPRQEVLLEFGYYDTRLTQVRSNPTVILNPVDTHRDPLMLC